MLRSERIKSLAGLYKALYWKYKFQMVFLAFLGVLNGFLASVGIVVLIPLLSLVLKQQSGQDSAISEFVEKAFLYLNWEPSIRVMLIGMVSIFVVKAFVMFLFDYIGGAINANVSNEIRKQFFKDTLKARWSYLVKQKIGYLDFALNEDLGTVMALLKRMQDFFMNMMSFLAYTVTAFVLSFYVTSFAVVAGGVLLYFSKFIAWKIKVYSKKGSLLKRSMSHTLNEAVLGLKAIKTMKVEDQSLDVLSGMLDRMKGFSLKTIKIKGLLTNPVEPIMVVFVASLFVISYKLPDFSFATFIVTVYLIQQIFRHTQKFQTFLSFFQTAMPAIERTMDLRLVLGESLEEDKGGVDFDFKDVIEFKNVTFSYNRDAEVLKNMSFKIKRGEMAGIIGPSGTGKTTIADLVMRLLIPTGGSILTDGRNVAEFTLDSWRRNIGYVSQDIFLKDGTIEENIKFYDSSITEKDIEHATKSANIFDFIKSLPEGFQTLVGDRGLFLSAGQRQRVALARVLARKPQILILDEATSSLDNESEALVKQAIEKLRGGITLIIIAHRISTISDVDHLIVLKEGGVAEEGHPQKLLEDPNSYFYKMNRLDR